MACDCVPAACHTVHLLHSVSLVCIQLHLPDELLGQLVCVQLHLPDEVPGQLDCVQLQGLCFPLVRRMYIFPTCFKDFMLGSDWPRQGHITSACSTLTPPLFPGVYLELAFLMTRDLILVTNHVIICRQSCISCLQTI